MGVRGGKSVLHDNFEVLWQSSRPLGDKGGRIKRASYEPLPHGSANVLCYSS